MGGYSGSKAGVELLKDARRLELTKDNIRFSTLRPGNTQTNFKNNALGPSRQKSGPTQRMSAEIVAQELVQVPRQKPRDAHVRFFDWASVFGSRNFPGLFDKLISNYYQQPDSGRPVATPNKKSPG